MADSPQAGQPVDLPAGTLLFHRNSIIDSDGTGLAAYVISIPAGWEGQCRVLWNLQRTVAPSDLYVRVTNPRGGQEFTYYPTCLFVWTPALEQASARLKGWVRGCRILQPIDGPLVAIQKIIIPEDIKDINPKYTVVSSAELPLLAAAYAPTYARPGRPPPTVRAGKVRIEYDEDGSTLQEDVYCVFVLTTGEKGSVWELDHIMTFKEEKGIPDQTDREFALMAVSLTPTPKFMDAMAKMTGILFQQSVPSPAALMQQVASAEKAQQEIDPDVAASWRTRQAAAIAAIESLGEGGLRGVLGEIDPHTGDRLPVPGDVIHTWSNSAGDIVYTDSATFKPSEIKDADWQELTPAKP
jgi:hypothetical protein